jgi:hypothetical protein
MNAPTIQQLLKESVVLDALEQAWISSLPGDRARRHEVGGWVYVDLATGAISVQFAPAGSRASLDLSTPPRLPGKTVVATFHTHPNPSSEGWESGPSDSDTSSALLLGVPCFIRADDGIYTTGPDSRRGGLAGGEGFPP